MSIELAGILIAIVAVGAALAGLIVTSVRGLRQDIRQDMARLESRLYAKINESESRLDAKIDGLESRLDAKINGLESRLDAKIDALDARIDGLEARMREDMKQLSDRLARVEHGQAKLEGLLEGLREAITGRAAAS